MKIIAGILSGFTLLVVIVAGLIILNGLQQSPAGQNPQANKTIENTKHALLLLPAWDDLLGTLEIVGVVIAGAAAVIGGIIWWERRHNAQI